MSEDSAPAAQQPVQEPDGLATSAVPPGLLALFLAFARMSLAGFGGVLVFARQAIVEQHRWMTADEFNETFALCHFLPGPNIGNASIVLGKRWFGAAGAVVAFLGLMLLPFIWVMALGVLYLEWASYPVVRAVVTGVGVSGLIAGTRAPKGVALASETPQQGVLGGSGTPGASPGSATPSASLASLSASPSTEPLGTPFTLPTAWPTPRPTAAPTRSPMPTPTASPTPKSTSTPSPTPTPTGPPTPTDTPTPTETPTPTPTDTPTPSPAASL